MATLMSLIAFSNQNILYFNAACRISDAIDIHYGKSLGQIEAAIFVKKLVFLVFYRKKQKHRVVIFSPNPYSRYTLSTLYLLERENIEISAVACLKLINIKIFF